MIWFSFFRSLSKMLLCSSKFPASSGSSFELSMLKALDLLLFFFCWLEKNSNLLLKKHFTSAQRLLIRLQTVRRGAHWKEYFLILHNWVKKRELEFQKCKEEDKIVSSFNCFYCNFSSFSKWFLCRNPWTSWVAFQILGTPPDTFSAVNNECGWRLESSGCSLSALFTACFNSNWFLLTSSSNHKFFYKCD